MKPLTTVVAGMIAGVASLAAPTHAGDVAFFDDFEDGASPLWGNEFGDWSAADGVYNAAIPSTAPNAHSTLPFLMADLTIEVDINNATDGGVWLRSQAIEGPVGVKGVLFVVKDGDVYWHVATDSGYGPILNRVNNTYPPGGDIHVRIEATCDTFAAYLNDSKTPVTTITTTQHLAGRVALYDFGAQTFDNVMLTGDELASACFTDFDEDGQTGPSDLAALLSAWGACGGCQADLNCDDMVDAGDLAALLAAWGPCDG